MLNLRENMNDAFTGKDGETLDLGRILWALGCLVFLALSTGNFLRGAIFDPTSFGIGFGGLLAGGGGALALKSHTEPDILENDALRSRSPNLKAND